MVSISRTALGAALALGSLGLAAAPALAQRQPVPVATLSKQERASLLALETALQANNHAAAASALSAAQSAARSSDARYYTASLQLRLGIATNNAPLQSAAIDAMLASGAVPAADLAQLYRSQGILALHANRWDRAETAFTRWAEQAPNDPEALLSLAEVKDDIKKVPEAIALIERAIALPTAAGRQAPESWYKRGLKHAFDSKAAAASARLSRGLVAAYPSDENWRDAVLVHRDLAPADPELTLDLLRLMRAAKAMGGERDFVQLAEALGTAKLPGEAKAVLDEGVSSKMVDAAKPVHKALIAGFARRATADKAALGRVQARGSAAAATAEQVLAAADASFAFADYAKAAEFYRAALARGGADTNLVNSRLGMALALAGRATEAEVALRAVTGTRADLANLWLTWLARRR
jgi:tetratricopeptide (TPR) repeat protein